MALVRDAGLGPIHVDVTLVMELPKLGAAREAIRERLAGVLALDVANVNVKATTGEGIGFVGRGEGVAALAIVTLAPRDDD